MDSLGAIELRNAVAATFAVTLPVTAAFDFPTITALAQHISTLLSVPTSAPQPLTSTSRVTTRAAAPSRRAARQSQAPAAQPEHPEAAETARLDAVALQAMIADLVRDILGVSVELDQPLMEVGTRPWLCFA